MRIMDRGMEYSIPLFFLLGKSAGTNRPIRNLIVCYCVFHQNKSRYNKQSKILMGAYMRRYSLLGEKI